MSDKLENILADAHKGDADSQYELAYIYEFGRGVSKDSSEALKWYEKAANQDHTEAHLAIGILLVKEKRIQFEEIEIKIESYYECFDNDDLLEDALYFNDDHDIPWKRLEIYDDLEGFKGLDAQSIEEKALLWIHRAAKYESLEAQIFLSERYFCRDIEESFRWAKLAAKQGNTKSQNLLGWMYANGEGISKNNKEALQWFRNAAENDNACAQFYLGWMYDNGKGALKDYKEASKWYKKAAEQDHSLISDYEFRSEMYLINIHKAQYYLGLMYENGKGVLKDHEKAIKRYKKAIDLICNESSGPEDWYRKVIDDEDVSFSEDASEWHILCEPKDHLFPEDHIFGTLTSACYNLGMKYFRGEGVLKDNDEAEEYFWESYWKGDVRSSYMLHMVDNGEDYYRDGSRAFSFLEFSAGAFIFSHTNTGGTDNSKHFNLNDIESYKKAVRKGYALSLIHI